MEKNKIIMILHYSFKAMTTDSQKRFEIWNRKRLKKKLRSG